MKAALKEDILDKSYIAAIITGVFAIFSVAIYFLTISFLDIASFFN